MKREYDDEAKQRRLEAEALIDALAVEALLHDVHAQVMLQANIEQRLRALKARLGEIPE